METMSDWTNSDGIHSVISSINWNKWAYITILNSVCILDYGTNLLSCNSILDSNTIDSSMWQTTLHHLCKYSTNLNNHCLICHISRLSSFFICCVTRSTLYSNILSHGQTHKTCQNEKYLMPQETSVEWLQINVFTFCDKTSQYDTA